MDLVFTAFQTFTTFASSKFLVSLCNQELIWVDYIYFEVTVVVF